LYNVSGNKSENVEFVADGKYLIYVPLDLAEDSIFPLKTKGSLKVKISFKLGDNKLTIEEWTE